MITEQTQVIIDFLSLNNDAVAIKCNDKIFICFNKKYINHKSLNDYINSIVVMLNKNVVCIIDDLREYLI